METTRSRGRKGVIALLFVGMAVLTLSLGVLLGESEQLSVAFTSLRAEMHELQAECDVLQADFDRLQAECDELRTAALTASEIEQSMAHDAADLWPSSHMIIEHRECATADERTLRVELDAVALVHVAHAAAAAAQDRATRATTEASIAWFLFIACYSTSMRRLAYQTATPSNDANPLYPSAPHVNNNPVASTTSHALVEYRATPSRSCAGLCGIRHGCLAMAKLRIFETASLPRSAARSRSISMPILILAVMLLATAVVLCVHRLVHANVHRLQPATAKRKFFCDTWSGGRGRPSDLVLGDNTVVLAEWSPSTYTPYIEPMGAME